MTNALSVPVGVIVARERSANPWQDYRWRPVRVFIDAGETTCWREVERGRGYVHYHAATLPLVLKGEQKVAYRVNLANGIPSVYVVLRESGGQGAGLPVSVEHITVSPFEIQAFGDQDSNIVDRVPMPEPLTKLIQSFVDDGVGASIVSGARVVGWNGTLAGLKFGV